MTHDELLVPEFIQTILLKEIAKSQENLVERIEFRTNYSVLPSADIVVARVNNVL